MSNNKNDCNCENKEKHEKHSKCDIDDLLAEELVHEFRYVFEDARVEKFPSHNHGVIVISHTVGDGRYPTINGLKIKSNLVNDAEYSVECAKNDCGKKHYVNLYEVGLTDIPGHEGEKSTVQLYVDKLASLGLQVNSVHEHWTGNKKIADDAGFKFITHNAIDVKPKIFVKKTIEALLYVLEIIEKRIGHFDDYSDQEDNRYESE